MEVIHTLRVITRHINEVQIRYQFPYYRTICWQCCDSQIYHQYIGGQYKRYKDTLKVTMKNFQIDPNNWEQAALDRPTLRSLIHKGGTVFEHNKIANAEKKRELRKQRQNSNLPHDDTNFTCPTCGRKFRARIGLFSHIRTHQRWTIWRYDHHPPWMDEL